MGQCDILEIIKSKKLLSLPKVKRQKDPESPSSSCNNRRSSNKSWVHRKTATAIDMPEAEREGEKYPGLSFSAL